MIAAAIALIALTTVGQPAPPDDSAAARAAVADACRRVAERVLDSPLGSGRLFRSAYADSESQIRFREWLLDQTVVDFIAADSDGDVLAGVSLYLDDGSALPEQLREALAGWRFREIGVASATTLQGTARPPGWENVSSQGLALAQRAAEYNLKTRAFDEIVTRLSARTPAPQLLSDSSLRTRFAANLVVDGANQPDFLPVQVCRITAVVSGARLAAALRAADSSIDETLLGQLAELIGDGGLSVTGYATPPGIESRRGVREAQSHDPPAWSKTFIHVMGRGAVDAGLHDPAEAVAAAVRAAHTDARIKLAEQIDQLALPGPQSATVGQYIRSHPDQAAWWSAFLRSGRYSPPRCSDGVCQVELTSDPSWLWNCIATGLDEWNIQRAAATQPAAQSLAE